MFRWISDFPQGWNFQVSVSEALPEVKCIENRTPQGSAISPVLFNMINDKL